MSGLAVNYTPHARGDLLDSWLYIGAENPIAADRVVDAIDRRLSLIAQHPRAGMPREEIGVGIRHLVVGQYLAFYRVTDEAIDVLRVLHGKRRVTSDDIG